MCLCKWVPKNEHSEHCWRLFLLLVLTYVDVTDGVVTDGIVMEDVAAEGMVTDVVVTEGVAAEDVVTEGVVTEGVVTEDVDCTAVWVTITSTSSSSVLE